MKEIKRQLYEGRNIKSIRELVENTVNQYADKVAFRYRTNPKDKNTIDVTYKEYGNDISYLDTSLLDLGLEGKKVVLISPNRYEWCVSYMAVSIGNMTIIPLDRSLPENELESLVIRAKADAVIFDEKYIDTFMKIKEEHTTTISYFICMDYKTDQNGIISYKKLINKGKQLIESGDTRYENAKTDTSKMSIMLFTSGTTSISKAVMLSQDNLCANVNAISKIIKLYSTDNMLSFLPLHHTFESTTTFLYGISCGVTIGFSDGLKYVVKNLTDYQVTAMVCVPIMLDSMLKKINKGIDETGKRGLINIMTSITKALLKIGIDLRRTVFKSVIDKLGGHLRLVVCGGAAMDPKTADGLQSFGIDILQGYGLTETSPVIAAESDTFRKLGSIGLPLYNLEVLIHNPGEDGIGELKVKGPSVMMGYYENEEATTEVLKDGWFYTGDLARKDQDGFLFITGRQKNVIVLQNGKNIFPEEIETIVNRLPYVSESIVFGKETEHDITLGLKLVYIKEELVEIFGEKSEEEYHDLIWKEIKEINQTLPKYKYVKNLIITEEPLIKTTTQKVKRHEEIKKILG